MSRAVVAVVALLLIAAQHSPAAQSRVVDLICGTGRVGLDNPAALADGVALFVEQTPGVLTPDYAGAVQLKVVYLGDVPTLRFYYHASGNFLFDSFNRTETRALAGRTVSIFQASWPVADFVMRYGLMIDFDTGQSGFLQMAPATVPVGSNGMPTQSQSFSIRAMSRRVGSVPVIRVNDTVQYSSHVVNLVLPGFSDTLGPGDSFDYLAAVQRFYTSFGDDYDVLAFVFSEKPFAQFAAYHAHVKNEISGIGMSLFDNSALFGSAGRLQGVDVYLSTIGNGISNHELSHQWGHFFDWQAIAGIAGVNPAHTPLWGYHESPIPFLLFPGMRLLPRAGTLDWDVVRAPEPTAIPPLQAYAMGRLPASSVPATHIFEDQNRPAGIFSGIVSGATRQVTLNQIVAAHGPRTGPVVQSLRRATVLVSREQLVSQREMDFWTFLAARLEDPDQTGMVDVTGMGSFRAISGAALQTGLVLPTGQTLAGPTVLEPATLDPGDIFGVTLDAAPKMRLAADGIFRIRGRIDHPTLRAATSFRMYTNSGETIINQATGADGTFAASLPVHLTPGRTYLMFELMLGPNFRQIAVISNVNITGGVSAPPPPVALTASVSGRDVSLQWSPDTGSIPSVYHVDVGSTPGASNIGTFPVTASSLGASGVPDGRYYIRVRAANAAGTSPPSTETAIEVGCSPPAPPGTLTGNVAGTTVSLNWIASPTPGVVYVVVAGSSSGASNIVQAGVGTATSLNAVAPVGRYFIRIRAVSSCGAFAESNEIDLPVGLPALPGAPASLTASVAGHTVSLTWQPASGTVSAYVIEAGSATGLSNLATVPVGVSTSFSAGGVPSGAYFVRVRASNAAGPGPPSNEVIVVVP